MNLKFLIGISILLIATWSFHSPTPRSESGIEGQVWIRVVRDAVDPGHQLGRPERLIALGPGRVPDVEGTGAAGAHRRKHDDAFVAAQRRIDFAGGGRELAEADRRVERPTDRPLRVAPRARWSTSRSNA